MVILAPNIDARRCTVIDPSSDCSKVTVQERETFSPVDSSSTTIEISHHDVRSQLSDYLDGSLGQAERRVVEAHLESCRECRAFRDTLRQTVHALDTLPSARAPTSTKQRILDRARKEVAQVTS
jgi:hypothetical protein